MLSASTAFATDDVALNEASDDITADETVLTVSDAGVNNQDIGVLSTSEDAVLENDENIVTNDTFYDYFNENGLLLDSVTSDELIFEGEFGGLGVNAVAVNRPITLTGSDAIFDGISFTVDSSNVTIDGFTIFQTNNDYGIWVMEKSDNVVVSNIFLDFTAVADHSYGIYAIESNNLQLLNNTILYAGNTDGTFFNNAVRIEGDDEQKNPSKSIVVAGNTFELAMPSVDISYDHDTWASTVMSEGIVFYYCEDLMFVDNNVKVEYNDVTTASGYDSLYAVSVRSDPYTFGEIQSYNVVIANNTIDIDGHSCAYAVYVCADEFQVGGNNITSTSETYLAHGIDIDGPSSDGMVYSNHIDVDAPVSYGIYSYQYMGAITSITYLRNNITVDGYLAGGMELVESTPWICLNTVLATGNYTYGILASILDEALIEDNVVNCLGSNVGDEGTGDPLMPQNSMGISVKGNCLISFNEVYSTNIGLNIVEKGGIHVEKNIIGVEANALIDSYAIHAKAADELFFENNTIMFIGNTDGTVVNNGVRIEGDDGGDGPVPANTIEFADNTFEFALPSVDVSYDLDTWASTVMSEGIVFYFCEDLLFVDNDVKLQYNNVTTFSGYDSLYAISVKSDIYTYDFDDEGGLIYPIESRNILIANNTIEMEGHSATYAITVAAETFEVSGNNITVTSETYLGHGIDVVAPSFMGLVDANVIAVGAPVSYGIYSEGLWSGPVEVVLYSNNNIFVEGYIAGGMELLEALPCAANNTIVSIGNYTYGIVASIYEEGEISGNNISVSGSNVGDEGTGDLLMPQNSMAISVKGKCLIESNTIESTNIGINIAEGTQITVDNNIIDVEANTGEIDNHAIVAKEVDELNITNNEISYVGASAPKEDYKTAKAYAVYVVDSEVSVEGNIMNITVPSLPADWEEVPAGSWNYVRHAYTEGLVFDECDFSIVAYNNITIGYSEGSYGSIYGIDVLDSDDFVIKNNSITSTGEYYMYGIILEGNDFIISNNTIYSISDYYANGIDIEESTGGTIESNVIAAFAPGVAYPIYGGMVGYPSVDLVSNLVYGNAYFTVGVEFSGENITLYNNLIRLKGNYTIGVGVHVDNLNATQNNIISNATNAGNVSIWDSVGTDTVGIKSNKGNVTAVANYISTTGEYTVDVADADGTVHDNYLLAKELLGDSSVSATKASVYDNVPSIKVILVASDLEKVYKDGQAFKVTALDEDGGYIPGLEIFLLIDDVIYDVVTTDERGIAEFDVDLLTKGTHNATVMFSGDGTYGPESIKNNIIVDTAESKLTAKYDDGNIVATLKDVDGNPIADAEIGFAIGGSVNYTNTDGNGQAKYSTSGLPDGINTVEVSFSGNDMYSANQTTVKFTFTKVATKLTVSGSISTTVNSGKYVLAVLKDADNNVVSDARVCFVVNGTANYLITDAKGCARYSTDNLKEGSYTVKVGFFGNDLYNASNQPTSKVVISRIATKLAVNNVATTYKSGKYVLAILNDANGNAIKGARVCFVVNGKANYVATDDNGRARYSTDNFAEGSYTVKVGYFGNDTYTPSNQPTSKVVISRIATKLAVNNVATTYKSGKYVLAILNDANGNAIKGARVCFVVNGKANYVATDDNGRARYSTDNFAVGNYAVKVGYFGNDTYMPSNQPTSKVVIDKVNKETPILGVQYTQFSADQKTKTVQLKILNREGKPLPKNTVLSFKVNGKTYSGPIDSNGIVRFNIDLNKPGIYNAEATFLGDNWYNARTTATKIIVK